MFPRQLNLIFAFTFFAFCLIVGLLNRPDLHNMILKGFMVVWVFSTLRELVFIAGSTLDRLRTMNRGLVEEHSIAHPIVSILVPAYNEEVVIAESLNSLARIDYPNFEIIVIDDGSADRTSSTAEQVASLHPERNIRVVRQANGGKASALNNGLYHAAGDLIFCVDADGVILPKTLRAGVRHFRDPEVGAVGGFVEVARRDKPILIMQYMEYMLSLQFVRRTLSFLGIVTVVPGPCGLFRKQALIEVGGFASDSQSFAEDAELTVRLLTRGWKIRSDEEMVARTEAPETIEALARQRYRWVRGLYQAMRENLPLLFEMESPRGRLVASYLWTETAFLPLANFGFTLYAVSVFLRFGRVEVIGLWAAISYGIDAIRLTLTLEKKRYLPLYLVFILPAKFVYDSFLTIWSVFCLFDEWRGVGMTWDKLQRTGIGKAS